LQAVRQWGRAVFKGQVAFDPEVERVWLESGIQLYKRSIELLSYGTTAEEPCYTLDGKAVLQSALWKMAQMLSGWVTPKLAVGPSARVGGEREASRAEIDDVRRRIAALPGLPANWPRGDSHPTAESRGYGTSIVRHLIDEAAVLASNAAASSDVLFLDVYETNARAINLYAKCGFTQVAGPFADAQENGQSYIVMAKRVAVGK
jgi:GNAT superfamily N-acetyltransferase